jgi:hypothetical protein
MHASDNGTADIRSRCSELQRGFGRRVVSDVDAKAAEKLWRAYQASIFDALGASSDPHDWAQATMVHVDFAKESDDANRAALMKRAVSALPDDAMIQWIALQQGQGKNAKVLAGAALQTLQNLELDNAAVWNEVLVRAAKSKDVAGEDSALARMAMSSRFDTHWAVSLRRLLDTFRRHPAPEDYIRLATKDSTKGDTLIANRIGLSVLRVSRIYTPDDVQRARPDDWVYRQSTLIVKDSSNEESLRDADSCQDDWFESGSEMEAMRRRVLRAGKPVNPPDDWVDDNSQFSDEKLRGDEEHFKPQASAR